MTPRWLRRLVAAWIALVLGRDPADYNVRHSLEQMLAMPADLSAKAETDADEGR